MTCVLLRFRFRWTDHSPSLLGLSPELEGVRYETGDESRGTLTIFTVLHTPSVFGETPRSVSSLPFTPYSPSSIPSETSPESIYGSLFVSHTLFYRCPSYKTCPYRTRHRTVTLAYPYLRPLFPVVRGTGFVLEVTFLHSQVRLLQQPRVITSRNL